MQQRRLKDGACALATMIMACTSGCAHAPSGSGDTAIVDPARWPTTSGGLQLDQTIEERITMLLAEMSLEDKVAQMIQGDTLDVSPDDVRKYRIGSVLSGGGSGPNKKPFTTAAEWLALNDALYDASMVERPGGPKIPVIIGIDAVHGHSKVLGATIGPHNIGLGATRNPELVQRLAEVTAMELAITGFDWDFSPTVAVARDDRWGRSYESFSEDPELVAQFSLVSVAGIQGALTAAGPLPPGKVIATAKHFLGDGGTFEGRDQGDTRSSEAELIAIHAAGYPPAIEAGVQAVMVSFSSWQGEKLHGHHGLITEVLKGRMRFNGFVVGDWNGHGQVKGCSNVSCPQSINAGLDMFMAPDSWKQLYAATLEQAQSGVIASARIDDAVRRILRVKLRAGLFERGRPSSRPMAGKFELLGSTEHRAVARQAVRESLVLLKNEGSLLPLRRNQKVLIAGDAADSIGVQCGGWTLDWQGGRHHKNELFPGGKSIFAGVREVVQAGGGRAVLSADGTFSERPDVAIVVYGEEPYAEFNGDRPTLEFKPKTPVLPLLEKLRAAGVPVVSVFLSGRPMFLSGELDASQAFVAAWLPGTEGGGVAEVLFRDNQEQIAHDFSGRLSFSWPRNARDSQNKGDAGYDPLFPFDYGLRYRP
jgi:beta-glucosidase